MSVAFTSRPVVQFHIKLAQFNRSGMKIVFGWVKLRLKRVITGVRHASARTN